MTTATKKKSKKATAPTERPGLKMPALRPGPAPERTFGDITVGPVTKDPRRFYHCGFTITIAGERIGQGPFRDIRTANEAHAAFCRGLDALEEGGALRSPEEVAAMRKGVKGAEK